MEKKDCTRTGVTLKRLKARRLYPHLPLHQKNKDTSLNPLGCWLRQICGRQWSDIALLLLKACFFLLFVWLLAELHMALPCLLVCGCLFNGPLRRVVNNAWTWITAHVRGRVLEQTHRTDGCTKTNETQTRDRSLREKLNNSACIATKYVFKQQPDKDFNTC